MKIKIGNRVYTSKDQPIMIILTEADKQNISNMLPECTKYCEYSKDNFTEKEIDAWMV